LRIIFHRTPCDSTLLFIKPIIVLTDQSVDKTCRS
jgi:hypothetical protein